MALTNARWLLILLVAFAVVPLLVMREPAKRDRAEPDRSEVLRSRADRARNRASRTAERYLAMRLHDSIVAAARRTPAQDVFLDAALDSATRTAAQRMIARAGLRELGSQVRVRTFVLLDTVTRVRGMQRSGWRGSVNVDHILPLAGTADDCFVVVRVNPLRPILNSRWYRHLAEMSSEMTARRLAGPCAFMAAFGHPGPHIRTWLDDRGWRLGEIGGWTNNQLEWLPPRWFATELEMMAASDRERALRSLLPAVGITCVQGNAGSCEAAVLQRVRYRPATTSGGRYFATGEYNAFLDFDNLWISRLAPFGSMDRTLLADMVRRLGPERFYAFWTSESPPSDAFRRATGRPLGEWTHEWAVQAFRVSGGGAYPHPFSVMTGFLICALAATVAVGVFQRRVVT